MSHDNPFDAIADDLQRLRAEAGGVSYAEIAARIGRRRAEQGMSHAAARVARSSVFDVFRPGRRRVNTDLVLEIVLALGEGEAVAAQWKQRCVEAQLTVRSQPSSGSTAPAVDPRLRIALVVVLLVAFVGVNLFGSSFSMKFHLPLYLDMVGTAVAAIMFGPWWGALVGLATNALGALVTEPQGISFALVSITGALLWGYGVRRFGAGRSYPRFLMLSIVVALACTIVAVPVTVFVYGGAHGHTSDDLAATLVALGEGLWLSVFSANLLTSLLDKLIAGGLALFLVRLLSPLGLSPGLRRNLPIVYRGRASPV